MPSWSEVLGNGAVVREEALRMPRGCEPLHGGLALTRWPMGALTLVVEITALAVFHAREELALRGTVALQVIGDDPWDVLTPFEQRAEKLLRGLFIAPTLHQDVEHVIVLVHRPPHVMPLTMHGEKRLIQVPLVPWLRATATQPIGVVLPKFPTPLADCFVGHNDTAFLQEFLYVAVAQGEAIGEPDTVRDDCTGKSMVLVTLIGGWSSHVWLPIL